MSFSFNDHHLQVGGTALGTAAAAPKNIGNLAPQAPNLAQVHR